MKISPILSSDLEFCFSISITFVSFIVYWFIYKSENIKKWFFSKYDFELASLRHVFFVKLMGLLVMGILPFLIYYFTFHKNPFFELGISVKIEYLSKSIFWIFILGIVVVFLGYLSGKRNQNHQNYPQVRCEVWTKKTLFIYLLSWSIYLIGYEILFRGVLLFPIFEKLGFWPAIIINLSLYSTTHIPKGLTETIGAIPLGFVLCVLTLETESVLIAVVVHILMAWSNSLSALIHNPYFRLNLKK